MNTLGAGAVLIGQGCSLRPINTTKASQGIYVGQSPNGRALFYLDHTQWQPIEW